ncbi:MAG TPA: glycosyltransferase [Stellaceae bacterium]
MSDFVRFAASYLGGKYLRFGWFVRFRSLGRAYDFCHAVDVMSLHAARGFAARGVPVLLDVNEIPDPFERQGARFTEAPAPVKRRLAQAVARDFTAASAIIATSDAMAEAVRELFGRDATAIRNARAPLDAPPSHAIRDDAGGGPETCVLAYPCTAAPHLGVETAIEILARLPEHFRLVFVGRFVTQAYRETVERRIRRLGVGHRIMLKDEVPEPDYLPYLAGTDIGLVPLSFDYRNQRVVLPWRVIDLTAAGVPMVASPSDAINRLAVHADIGEVTAGTDVGEFVAAIRRLAAAPPARIDAIKRGLCRVAEEFSPAREAARYRAMLAALAARRHGRAAFVVNLALRRNRRVIGFIDEACALGWRVDLYCVRAPRREWFRHPDQVRFVEISDRWLSRFSLPHVPNLAAPFAGIWFGLRQLRRARRFARAMEARRGDWDMVIATDLFALPAGLRASRRGSFLVYDAVEIPDLRRRTSPLLRAIPAPLRLPFYLWERRFIARVGLVLTPSHALAAYLRRRYRRRDVPVRAIRNAAEHDKAPLRGNEPGLRDILGIPASDIVLVSPCGISAETGAVLAARSLRFLPPDHVLVFIGRFATGHAEAAIRAVLQRDRTAHRCFFVGEESYPQYRSWLGDCDLGLVLFDPAIANMRLAAPNRFFDLLAARVPTIATEIDEVAAILRRTGIGTVLRERRPVALARAVTEARERFGIAQGGVLAPHIRERLVRVAQFHRADKEMARLVAMLTRRAGDLRGKRVALMTLRSAFSNRRFRRIAGALQEAGASVAGFDTDIGRIAPEDAPPDWLTTIPIR